MLIKNWKKFLTYLRELFGFKEDDSPIKEGFKTGGVYEKPKAKRPVFPHKPKPRSNQ